MIRTRLYRSDRQRKGEVEEEEKEEANENIVFGEFSFCIGENM